MLLSLLVNACQQIQPFLLGMGFNFLLCVLEMRWYIKLSVCVCVREGGSRGGGGGHEVMRAVVESGKVATPCPSCLPRCHVLPPPELLLLFSPFFILI